MIVDTSPRIVIVDDSEDDFLLIARQIQRSLPNALVQHADNLATLQTLLQQGIDLVVCDYSMDGLTHEEVVSAVQAEQPEIPLILMSGMAGERLGAQAMQTGVRDYVEKAHPDRLIPVIRRELGTRQLHHTVQDLQRARDEADARDTLTGFLNASAFAVLLAERLNKPGGRQGVLLSVVMGESVRQLGGEESELNKRLRAELTERLKRHFTTNNTARWADGHFVTLLDGPPLHQNGEEECAVWAQQLFQIEQDLMQALWIGQITVKPDLKLGVARLGEDGLDTTQLVLHAQAVSAVLRKMGWGLASGLDATIHGKANRRKMIQTGLSQGIERDELTLMYQPVEDLSTQQVVGVEALVRWRHPDLGLIMPDEFIGVAEDGGLIEALGLWVIRKASQMLAQLHRQGHAVWCAVNCSANQLLREDFAQVALAELSTQGVHPRHIEFEITESAAIEDMGRTVTALERLRKSGCKVAMDDFGTGYASLNYLRKLPIDVLKIDKSFIQEVTHSERSQKIVKAVIDLAHALNLTVHAEGIELAEQREHLMGLGCDRLQGYLLARPLRENDLLPWLEARQQGLTSCGTPGPLRTPV